MTEHIDPKFSRSEDAGVAAMPADAAEVYSVGISTGGVAEIRMAAEAPQAHIVATTVDEKGVAFARERITEQGVADRIQVKLEDVAQPLAYADGYFDYVYARLVLHYLAKADLASSLLELYRVLKAGGKLFVVVRSTECPDAMREGVTYDDETGLTSCTVHEDDKTYSYSRYFHTQDSISSALKTAGFSIESIEQYDEKLFKDFMRTVPSDFTDNVIQVIAGK
ncbi:MAG TPA: methyltransferase domain-containing protein [Candidatus Saccharimonadales bacterium]|nr:methyltransferase domain-containing protein [Candidatus Saccharimonadales bacterium]